MFRKLSKKENLKLHKLSMLLFRLFIVFVWLILSRSIFLLIYLFLLSPVLRVLPESLFLQIVDILCPAIVLLLIEAIPDYFFVKRLFCSTPNDIRKSFTKFVSVCSKLIVTVAIMFVLGVKDSAYNIAQENGRSLELLFAYDIYIMFLASSIAGFDYILEITESNK